MCSNTVTPVKQQLLPWISQTLLLPASLHLPPRKAVNLAWHTCTSNSTINQDQCTNTGTQAHTHTYTDTHAHARYLKLLQFFRCPPPLNHRHRQLRFELVDLLLQAGVAPRLARLCSLPNGSKISLCNLTQKIEIHVLICWKNGCLQGEARAGKSYSCTEWADNDEKVRGVYLAHQALHFRLHVRTVSQHCDNSVTTVWQQFDTIVTTVWHQCNNSVTTV
jgi:hypothetical protein